MISRSPFRHLVRRFLAVAVIGSAAAAAPGTPLRAQAQAGDALVGSFDRRDALDAGVAATASGAALAALDTMRGQFPGLAVTLDARSGVTRTLYNRDGFLSEARAGDPGAVALAYLRANAAALSFDVASIDGAEVTDVTVNRTTGSTHVYRRQRIQGLPVYDGFLQVNINRDGRVISVNNSFAPSGVGVAAAVLPGISAADAVAAAAAHLGLANAAPARVVTALAGVAQATTLDAAGISLEPVDAELMWLPMGNGEVRLVWRFQIHTPDRAHAWDMTVDAGSSEVLTRFDWVASDSYTVYPAPIESPSHTTPAPPADGRVRVDNPAHPVASPFGWHDVNGVAGADYTIMRGNNVQAYDDADANNLPPLLQPDCGAALNCTFPIALTSAPSASRSAAIANLFYWNNLIHDVQYQYGFTEAAGNFQVNNYGRGGLGNDEVLAEAQDGGGTDNANFFTPADGSRPRMQMYLWTRTNPGRDGDFDSGIIVHEYGHGISNRLVGGPSNVSCLSNAQQPGEGLSDWWALVYTARPEHTGAMGRGIATYSLGQSPTGAGLRGQRYSTDPAISTWTYGTIASMSGPHAIGSVWAQAAWEMYWALVSRHGFSANLYDATGTAGNQRAMLYVNEGLMNTICRPSFTDVRDGILQAARDNHAGEDVCLLWEAFADFGLGVDAISGGPSTTLVTNGFTVPTACVTATLAVSDAGVSEGHAGVKAAAFRVKVGQPGNRTISVSYATAPVTASGSAIVANTSPITIPSSGNATPYPSTVVVPATTGTVSRVRVTLHGFSHSYPGDVDMLLVGPAGQSVMLMSDAGGWTSVTNLTLSFDDAAPSMSSSALASTTYRPTDVVDGGTDAFLPPAPGAPYGGALGVFAGTNPSGTWSLFVRDDLGGFSGSISGGWSLTVATTAQDFVGVSGVLTFPPGVTEQVIQVPVNGDTQVEPSETFQLALVNGVNAAIVDGVGVGTIANDDFAEPIAAGLVIKAAQIMELRTAINEVRVGRGLGAFVFTDATPVIVRAVHVIELRAALAAIYAAGAQVLPVYTDPQIVPGETVAKAAHVTELRTALANLP